MATSKTNGEGYGSSIAIIIILILMIVGFSYVLKNGNTQQPGSSIATSTAPTTGTPPSSAPATTTFPSYYQDPSTWQSATNTNADFSISYPLDFTLTTTAGKDFTLTVPKAFEPQTNFDDATLTVGRGANTSAVSNCLVATNGETEADGPVYINNIEFNVFTNNDAGAGNLYDTTSYRTVHNNQCYTVEYTIHSSQLSDYPASYDLTQFDMDKIQSTLDLIVSTFAFLN